MRRYFVYAVLRMYGQERDDLIGLHATQVGAIARVHEEVTRWEGRLLWWPITEGMWVAQLLVRDFQRGGRYKLFATQWMINPKEVGP